LENSVGFWDFARIMKNVKTTIAAMIVLAATIQRKGKKRGLGEQDAV
jgi:hypothetical protein